MIKRFTTPSKQILRISYLKMCYVDLTYSLFSFTLAVTLFCAQSNRES